MAGGSTVEKTDLLFAAGDYYDMHPYGLRVWEVNRWAMDGHIVPPLSITGRTCPTTGSGGPMTTGRRSRHSTRPPDGKIYMLLSKNPRTISRGFVYRKDLVEDAGLEFPTTIDEYTELLRALKANNPDHYPLFTRGQGGIFTDVFYNTWRTTAGVHFDIDSGELVYGAATDKMRELIKYFTGIYAEGLMDAEFLTNTRERENEILYVANTAIHHPQLDRQRPVHEQHVAQGQPGRHLDPLLHSAALGAGCGGDHQPGDGVLPVGSVPDHQFGG